jgi:hypothetical protein
LFSGLLQGVGFNLDDLLSHCPTPFTHHECMPAKHAVMTDA